MEETGQRVRSRDTEVVTPRAAPAARPQRSEQRTEKRPPRDKDVESRPEPAPRPRREESDEPLQTYRIEVGEIHGAKPANIVGAIANEAGLEGKFIGRVVIREDHSFVDLPGGMPKEIFRSLQKVRVAGQQLQISLALRTQAERLRRERTTQRQDRDTRKPKPGHAKQRRK